MLTTITTWSLQMLRAEMLIPAPRPPSTAAPGLAFERVIAPTPAFARYLYTAVGGDWHWHDRLSWTHARWQRWLDREQVSIWLAWQGGAPSGYIELEQQSQGAVEIVYFGLLPQAIGTGLGAWLLYTGSARAWALPGTRRVWVHTCSLDHPRALDNYRRRGFEVFRTDPGAAVPDPAAVIAKTITTSLRPLAAEQQTQHYARAAALEVCKAQTASSSKDAPTAAQFNELKRKYEQMAKLKGAPPIAAPLAGPRAGQTVAHGPP